MIEWLNGKIAEVTSLVQAAAVVVAIAIVLYAYAKTRSLVTLVVSALTAGFFLWVVNSPDWWQQKVSEESLAELPGVAAAALPDLAEGSQPGLWLPTADIGEG